MTLPVELLIILYSCPAVIEVVGSTTVWVVVPVKTCTSLSELVRVVVPAAVAVEVTVDMKLLANRAALPSRNAAVLTVDGTAPMNVKNQSAAAVGVSILAVKIAILEPLIVQIPPAAED